LSWEFGLGIFDKRSRDFLSASLDTSAYAAPDGIAGLFTPSSLPLSIFHDVDSSAFPVSVSEAMSVPAVSRAIGLYSGVCSRFPLTATNNAEWLNWTQGAVTPKLRLATTVQDLIFHNAAVWGVSRDEAGYVNYAERIHPSRWGVNSDGRITVDGKVAADKDVIYIPSLLPDGFLSAGRASVRHYVNLSKTINNRSAQPAPAIVVGETADTGATGEEIDELISRLTETLESGRGGIVFRPHNLEISSFGASDSANQMMIDAREAVRKDLANHLHVHAALLDGVNSGASDVYSNAIQSKNEALEFSFKLFTEPIADRLSQDDVTPSGVKVAFDYSSFESVADAKGNVATPTAQETENV
jgi:hypothetical protein